MTKKYRTIAEAVAEITRLSSLVSEKDREISLLKSDIEDQNRENREDAIRYRTRIELLEDELREAKTRIECQIVEEARSRQAEMLNEASMRTVTNRVDDLARQLRADITFLRQEVTRASLSAPAAAPSSDGTTIYDLFLTKVGSEVVKTIKEIRAITGLGLTESKDLVESARQEHPVRAFVRRFASEADVVNARKTLEALHGNQCEVFVVHQPAILAPRFA